MARVVATSPIHPDAARDLQRYCDFSVADNNRPETILKASRDARVLIVRDPLPPDIFDRCPNLAAVIRHGTGLDVIPLEEATHAGVIVANTPGENACSVAEYIVMMSLMLLRRPLPITWPGDGVEYGWWPSTLGGKTIGVIGAGSIAGALAKLVCGFNTRVVGYRRKRKNMPDGVDYCDVTDLLTNSDVVVIALPSNESTKSSIGLGHLTRMKPGAVLVSVSRSDVLDTHALTVRLERNHLSGAAIDVFGNSEGDRRLLNSSTPGLLVTKHLAGVTEDAFHRMGTACVRATRSVLEGRPPAHFVNLEAVRSHTRISLNWEQPDVPEKSTEIP